MFPGVFNTSSPFSNLTFHPLNHIFGVPWLMSSKSRREFAHTKWCRAVMVGAILPFVRVYCSRGKHLLCIQSLRSTDRSALYLGVLPFHHFFSYLFFSSFQQSLYLFRMGSSDLTQRRETGLLELLSFPYGVCVGNAFVIGLGGLGYTFHTTHHD